MKRITKWVAVLTLSGLSAAAMAQDSGWGTSPTRVYGALSTQGVGFGVAKALNSSVDLRAGLSVLNYSTTGRGDINADANLKMQNVGFYADWFPVESSGFRLTAGYQFGDNKVDITGKPSGGTLNVGNGTYSVAAGDSITGQLNMGNSAPYLGLGWSQHGVNQTGLSFNFDLGVRFGKADVSLTRNGFSALPTATLAQLDADIQTEQTKLANDLKVLKTYPVIGVGLSYRW